MGGGGADIKVANGECAEAAELLHQRPDSHSLTDGEVAPLPPVALPRPS